MYTFQHAAVAFSSLCHALQEKEMVAIVRYVSRGNTDPKLGFLAPHIKSSYEVCISNSGLKMNFLIELPIFFVQYSVLYFLSQSERILGMEVGSGCSIIRV